jgi:hypothetical protein
MNIPLADYQIERAAFEALLKSICERRILLFRGESGTGKTTLLNNFRGSVKKSPDFLYVNIDLKGTAVTVGEILSRTSDRLGENQRHLRQSVAQLSGVSDIDFDDVKQSGFGNKINVTLQVNDPNDREQRRVVLTEALFADLKTASQSILFIFDTYQDATTEVQDWIGGPFLARVESTPQVRVVIAGQSVPEENNIEWGDCCSVHHLKGVLEAEHWLPVVEAMNFPIPAADPLSWLVGICGLLKGRPSDIMQHLKAEQERSLR